MILATKYTIKCKLLDVWHILSNFQEAIVNASLAEVREVVARLRGGKANGNRNISIELLKAGGRGYEA